MELAATGLETSLLRLTPLGEADREDVRRSNAVDDMWTSMMVVSSGMSMDAYFNHTLRMAETGIGLGLTARLKSDDSLAGLAAFLLPNRLHRRTRIGYIWIRPDLRGQGLTNHIHYLMLHRAIEWRARRVEWWIPDRNTQAVEKVERLGAQREGLLRQHSRFADGSWVNMIVMSLINDEIRTAMREMGRHIGEA